jgi:uridine phosphorylase
VPLRLRPTAPLAADAILVGDPGRALLLAQELLEQPKMSNHARGLWGYSGRTPAGDRLTIQATGIGGPSAALVLGDLAELGVRRAIRVGSCAGGREVRLGDLLVVSEALAEGGSASAHGLAAGAAARPDPDLTRRLAEALGDEGRTGAIASFDSHPRAEALPAGVLAADMQTAPLLGRARDLDFSLAAVLIAAEIEGGDRTLEKEELELREKRAGQAASSVLST